MTTVKEIDNIDLIELVKSFYSKDIVIHDISISRDGKQIVTIKYEYEVEE